MNLFHIQKKTHLSCESKVLIQVELKQNVVQQLWGKIPRKHSEFKTIHKLTNFQEKKKTPKKTNPLILTLKHC